MQHRRVKCTAKAHGQRDKTRHSVQESRLDAKFVEETSGETLYKVLPLGAIVCHLQSIANLGCSGRAQGLPTFGATPSCKERLSPGLECITKESAASSNLSHTAVYYPLLQRMALVRVNHPGQHIMSGGTCIQVPDNSPASLLVHRDVRIAQTLDGRLW
eukprot:306223-Amphidinium_carterae.1